MTYPRSEAPAPERPTRGLVQPVDGLLRSLARPGGHILGVVRGVALQEARQLGRELEGDGMRASLATHLSYKREYGRGSWIALG